jgi:hypothetical protein
MEPPWVAKTDRQQYPVRHIADLWQKRLYGNFRDQVWISPKEYGQLKDLLRFLGGWTQLVVEWMTEPKHWLHFTGKIQLEAPKIRIPLIPHIGFLLQQRTRALKIMREYLRDSESPAAIRFVAEQDLIARKNLLEASLLLSGDKPQMLSKITAARTPAEAQQILAELPDEHADATLPPPS